MKKILSLLITISILLLSIILDTGVSGLSAFWNIPSLFIVVFTTVPMLIVSDNFPDFIRSFDIFITNHSYTTKEMECSVNATSLAIRLIYLSGGVGALIGLVNILGRLDDPAALGPAFAVMLLTLFYAITINFFLNAVRAKIKKELIYRK